MAEIMEREALDSRGEVLGKEHPDTLTSAYCSAYMFHQKRQYHNGSLLYERARAGYEKTLGLNHPTTLWCSNHYSAMLNEMEAELS